MKFEDRVQLKLSDLTEELFEKIVAYGRSYQFYRSELNNLNYHRE